jgi:hypothetical protein
MIVVTAALALGALDSTQFATQTRKRARQSLGVAVIWAVGCLFSLFTAHGTEIVTTVIAALLALGSVALLVIHVRHGIAAPRVWLAPLLALLAVVFAVASL